MATTPEDTIAGATEAPKSTATATQLLKDSAAKIGKQAVDHARTYAEDGKARAGGALDEIVKMINDAAGTVDEKLGDQYGQYARTAADKVADFSEGLKAKQLDDLIEDARGFVLVRLIQSGLAVDRDTKA